MWTTRRNILCIGALTAGLLAIIFMGFTFVQTNSVLANGGKAKNFVYKAQTALDNDADRKCSFSAEVNPVLFYFTTVNNKYQVLLVRIQNQSRTALRLSKTQDKLTLRFGPKAIPAVIDLPASDQSTWDAIGPEMRKIVAYPPLVEAGEEEGVYVYVAADVLKDFRSDRGMPQSLSFAVDSIGRTIEISRPIAAAKK